jgi:hypothetical protein
MSVIHELRGICNQAVLSRNSREENECKHENRQSELLASGRTLKLIPALNDELTPSAEDCMMKRVNYGSKYLAIYELCCLRLLEHMDRGFESHSGHEYLRYFLSLAL